jgi:hypothetical protein
MGIIVKGSINFVVEIQGNDLHLYKEVIQLLARREPVAMEDLEILFGLSGMVITSSTKREQQEIATHANYKNLDSTFNRVVYLNMDCSEPTK